MQIADFSLSIRGMQGVTDRNSLNWLFGVSCIVFTLLSCVSWGSGSISRGSNRGSFLYVDLPGS